MFYKDTDQITATTDVTPRVIENDVLILTVANMVCGIAMICVT